MPVVSSVAGCGNSSLGVLKRINPLSARLGTAAAFSILATTITTSGACSANWAVGVAGLAGVITSTGAGLTVGGTIHIGDEIALKAYQDLQAAFDYFVSLPYPAENVIAGDMIGKTLLPGVYSTEAAVTCTGPMYFDDPDGGGVFIIVLRGGAYTPAAGAITHLLRFARFSSIYWILAGGALSSGGASNIAGNIISSGAITIGDGGRVDGQLLALGGATLANNVIFST
jgi:cytoskeletal protein CcmA (bactofilin family)